MSYKIEVAPKERTSTSLSAASDTIHGALDAAWMLNRHTESEVWISEDGRHLATLSLTWED